MRVRAFSHVCPYYHHIISYLTTDQSNTLLMQNKHYHPHVPSRPTTDPVQYTFNAKQTCSRRYLLNISNKPHTLQQGLQKENILTSTQTCLFLASILWRNLWVRNFWKGIRQSGQAKTSIGTITLQECLRSASNSIYCDFPSQSYSWWFYTT